MRRISLLSAATVALMIDYFLYVTGNLSLIYSVLGGWFILNSVLLVAVMVYTVFYAVKLNRRQLAAIYVLGVLVVSLALFGLTDFARNHAKSGLHVAAIQVLESGLDSKSVFTLETEENFKKLSKLNYDLQLESFIPTRRRVDYILRLDGGQRYRFVLIKRRDNSNQVYMGDAKLQSSNQP